MRRRIWTLARYFLRMLFTSFAGLVYLLVALAYWYFFFPPSQGTPDFDNYVLIIGALGAVLSFLITLSLAAQANEASNYPLLVRLPSKVEYLTAVLLSTLVAATLLQLLVALLALIGGPEITLGQMLEIPPIWLAVNVFAAVLAVHASDFVTFGWSRVYLFGILAIFLFGQNVNAWLVRWLSGLFGRLGGFFFEYNIVSLARAMNSFSVWLNSDGSTVLQQFFGFIFWPFRAISEAVLSGFFNATQALAPAVILLYATILFMLAADLFANKDIDFTE